MFFIPFCLENEPAEECFVRVDFAESGSSDRGRSRSTHFQQSSGKHTSEEQFLKSCSDIKFNLAKKSEAKLRSNLIWPKTPENDDHLT